MFRSEIQLGQLSLQPAYAGTFSTAVQAGEPGFGGRGHAVMPWTGRDKPLI
jgi:hypothetical protein